MRSNHSSITAVSLLYCRTGSIGVCANAIGRPSASVRISAASGIVRTSPARSISRRRESPGQRGTLETEGRQQVLHEEHRTQDHMRGEAEAAYGLLDAPLVVEVRDARLLVRRSNGCVDVVFDAGFARQ